MSYRTLENDYLEEEFQRTIDSDTEIRKSNRSSLSSLSNNSDNNIMDSFSSSNSEIKCRICYETVEDPRQYCNCDGSIAVIHLECLKKWIVSNNYKLICEICKEPYNLKVKWSSINCNNFFYIIYITLCNVFFWFIYWLNYIQNIENGDGGEFYIAIGAILTIVMFVWSFSYYKRKRKKILMINGSRYNVENLNESVESIPIINTLTLTDSP
jgi:E3 ubiquitin-protein ligase DOA10